VEDWVDEVIGYGIGIASWLEEGGEKTAINERGNIRYEEDVILEKSEEETKSRVVDWLVEEKKIRILDTGEDMRCDKDIVLERKKERDRLGKTESRVDEIVSCSVRAVD